MKWLGALLLALATKLACSEFTGWLPHVSAWLLRGAVRRLPLACHDRLREEWGALLLDLKDRPVSQLLTAAGFSIAAWRIAHQLRFPDVPAGTPLIIRGLDIIISSTLLLPAVVIAACGIVRVFVALRRCPGFSRGVYLGRDFRLISTWFCPELDQRSSFPISAIEFPIRLWSVLWGDLSFVGGPRIAEVTGSVRCLQQSSVEPAFRGMVAGWRAHYPHAVPEEFLSELCRVKPGFFSVQGYSAVYSIRGYWKSCRKLMRHCFAEIPDSVRLSAEIKNDGDTL